MRIALKKAVFALGFKKSFVITFIFGGILHKFSFGAVFIFGMLGRRVVFFFLKFLVHSVLVILTAGLDFLFLKDTSQQISQTVGYLSRQERLPTKQEPAVKNSALAFSFAIKLTPRQQGCLLY